MATIKVHVCRQKGRTNLAMRYVDPDTGKQVWRMSGMTNHNKATKAAAVWGDAPGAILVDFSGRRCERRPMFRIPAESEKYNTHRILPMAPEFAQLRETVPENQRRGCVFKSPADAPRGLPDVRCRWRSCPCEDQGADPQKCRRQG